MIRIHKNLSTKLSILVNRYDISRLFKPISAQKKPLLFTPKTCQLCDERVKSYSFFCDKCYLDLPSPQTKCTICCLPLEIKHSANEMQTLICGECLTKIPSFTVTLCPFKYEFPIKQLIAKVKYSKQRYWILPLSWALSREYLRNHQAGLITKPDFLVPVPLHKSKQKTRGYNQAELLAEALMKSTGIPIFRHGLIKVRATETQAQLNKQERMKNLMNTFSMSKKELRLGHLKNKHIALIDDVMTTKVTCELASKLLLEHGVKQVDIWCIARTPKSR